MKTDRYIIKGESIIDTVDDELVNCNNDENNIEVIVSWLNELSNENKELKSKVDDKEVAVEVETCKCIHHIYNIINSNINNAEYKRNKAHIKAKIKNYSSKTRNEVTPLLDMVWYWKGHVDGLTELKNQIKEK